MKPISTYSFFSVFLVACGTDLPEGWEDATLIENLEQSTCQGDPMAGDLIESQEDSEEISPISGTIEGGEMQVQFSKAELRCDQEVAGFHMISDNKVSILVQPKNMNPSEVPKCSCYYDLNMTILDLETESYSLEVFQRGDNYGGEASMVLIDSITIEP